MLSFWILLLEQFLLSFLTFPESAGSVIWCAVCHAGLKGRSRAAERPLFCHSSPVVLAGTLDQRARKSSAHLSLCINALAFRVAVENCF